MTSLQSRLLYTMMKNRHLLQGRLRQEAWDFNTSVPAFRALAVKSNARLAAVPAGLTVERLSVGGRPAEWLSIPAGGKDKVILYAIGGGYISGSLDDHRNMIAKVVLGSGVTALAVEHRLAPEDPYPAALDDLFNAYCWLLERGTLPHNIVLMGESAGGGLALATLLAIRDRGLPLPAAAVALSPWTDLALTGESHRTRARVCLSPAGMATVCSKYYAGDNDPKLPYISPLYGDLCGLPPLYISVGDWETMRDDATRFAAKAQEAGVEVTLVVGEKMVHCYPLMAPLFPEATHALADVCTFIRGI
jgi:acetyl esterase/lipase